MTGRLARVRLAVLVESAGLARAALEGGAGMIQLRAKGITDRALLQRADQIAALCRDAGAVFVVNDRPDVASLAGADGVHLGQEDLPCGRVREFFGSGLLVGASAHSREEIERAVSAGADYLGVGTIFATGTKPDLTGQGLAILRVARERSSLPFFAIGGITLDNVDEVMDAGAHGVAIAGAIAGAPDPRAATEAFARRLSRLG